MEKILFEKEICDFLKLPSIPKKEWDGETPFDKGVAIVKMAFDQKGYAVARYDTNKEQKPNVIKVFASEPFFDVDKILVVPDYMETDVKDADLDDESKKKAEELAKQAEEIENDGNDDVVKEPENEYYFDNITNDEEAIAFITAYNQKNGIKGTVPKKHDTIVMRLSVIFADMQKASGSKEFEEKTDEKPSDEQANTENIDKE